MIAMFSIAIVGGLATLVGLSRRLDCCYGGGMLLCVGGIYVALKGPEILLRWIVEPANCGVRMQRLSNDASCAPSACV
jgi:hypothetical protein